MIRLNLVYYDYKIQLISFSFLYLENPKIDIIDNNLFLLKYYELNQFFLQIEIKEPSIYYHDKAGIDNSQLKAV